MKICCFGSLNIDMVFNVDDFAKPKETIKSNGFQMFPGGKGLNQAIAIKKSGAEVFLAGSIGTDGQLLINQCDKHCLDRTNVRIIEGNSGLAVIQVNSQGENCIILSDGANKQNDIEFIDSVINKLKKNDIIILQNEINNLEYIINASKKNGIKICLNPSPVDESLFNLPIELCDIIILNEVEGKLLSGKESYDEIIVALAQKYQDSIIILTLGGHGVYYTYNKKIYKKDSLKVEPLDTTGAGDAFTGYFIGMLSKGFIMEESIDIANKAAAISVTRRGASESIPYIDEVLIK